MRTKLAVLGGVLAIVLASHARAAAQDRVVFALNWIPNGNHYGIFVAKEEGFYRAAGLDVDVQRGYGSGDTVKRVASGNADLGIADAASVIVGRGNGLKVRQIASMFDRAPDAIFYVESSGITKPKDLEGHSLGASTGETTLELMPVFDKNAGVDGAKINIINIAPSAKYASLVSKKVDAIVGFANEEPVIQAVAKKEGVKIGRFLFSDYGIDYYSIGIISSDEALTKRSDVIRRALAATLEGYRWAIKNPRRAADDFAKDFPESNRDLSLQQWDVAQKYILTDRTRAHGLGWIDPAKMRATLTLIKKFQKLNGPVVVGDIYSAAYLPKSVDK